MRACASLLVLLAMPSTGTAQERERATRIPAPADPNQRLALVVGNAEYAEDPLRNPVNDARAMAKTLDDLGFDVILRENVTQRQMEAAAQEFGRRLANEGVGVFYYAGHGLQVGGINYLIPIEANIEIDADVKYEAVAVQRILDTMDREYGINIVILDACRNDPFSARWGRESGTGFARQDAPTGTLLAYATAPNMTALDGDGDNNSPYTATLLRQMRVPQSVSDMFVRVTAEVSRKTGDAQVPWTNSSLRDSFSFSRGDADTSVLEVIADHFDKDLVTFSTGVTKNPWGQVTSVRLSRNGLMGDIPVELAQLSQLVVLDLSENDLLGPIPAELGQLSQLRELNLSANNLKGPIPVELGQLSQLRQLFLAGDPLYDRMGLTGQIPAELGNLSQLIALDLSYTELSGEIPAELGNLSQLTDLHLSDTDLSGEIPAELGSLLQLKNLDLSYTDLSGEIPAELGNLSELEYLNLSLTNLSGEIPAELGNLSELWYLDLANNDLSVQVPEEVVNMMQNISTTGIFDFGDDLPDLVRQLPARVELDPASSTFPYRRWIAGGSRPVLASCDDGDVDGYVAEVGLPDFTLYWGEVNDILRIYYSVVGEDEAMLIVRLPNGTWACDDIAGRSLNPEVILNSPVPGKYEIWAVGPSSYVPQGFLGIAPSRR